MGRKKGLNGYGDGGGKDEKGRMLWMVVFAGFVLNIMLFQLIFHKHVVTYSPDQSMSLRGADREAETKEDSAAETFRTTPPLAPIPSASTNTPNRWGGTKDSDTFSSSFVSSSKISDASRISTLHEDLLKEFKDPPKFDDLARPSDKVMVAEALDMWKLLWRGIASLCVYSEFQSDPETSWELIGNQLHMLQKGGIDVAGPVERIRQGYREKSKVMQDVQDGKNSVVAEAIVDSILEFIRVSEKPARESNEETRVDRIDAMMLLRNLLNNKWHRKQQAAREAFFRKYHENFLENHAAAVSSVVSGRMGLPNDHLTFPPL